MISTLKLRSHHLNTTVGGDRSQWLFAVRTGRDFYFEFSKITKIKNKNKNEQDSNRLYFIHIYPIGQIEREGNFGKGEEVSEKAGETRVWLGKPAKKTKRNEEESSDEVAVQYGQATQQLLYCMFKYEAVGGSSLFSTSSVWLCVGETQEI